MQEVDNGEILQNISKEFQELNNFVISKAFACLNIAILCSIMIFAITERTKPNFLQNLKEKLQALVACQAWYFLVSSLYYLYKCRRIYNKYLAQAGTNSYLASELLKKKNEYVYMIFMKTPVIIWAITPLFTIGILIVAKRTLLDPQELLHHLRHLRHLPTLLSLYSLYSFIFCIKEILKSNEISLGLLFGTFVLKNKIFFFSQYFCAFVSLVLTYFMLKFLHLHSENVC